MGGKERLSGQNMNKTALKKIIRQGESETVEFKSSFDIAAIETLVALLMWGAALFLWVWRIQEKL